MDVNKLIPYEFNNRKHPEQQVERIARSIKEFGFNQPIVIDEDNVILVGHGRLYAAKQLGLDDVPVKVVKGLTDEQKRAYRILDNKLQNDSQWDFDNVNLEIGWLEDHGLELEPWGLDELPLKPFEAPEVDESIVDGLEPVSVLRLKGNPSEINKLEKELDELLRDYPLIKKEKQG